MNDCSTNLPYPPSPDPARYSLTDNDQNVKNCRNAGTWGEGSVIIVLLTSLSLTYFLCRKTTNYFVNWDINPHLTNTLRVRELREQRESNNSRPQIMHFSSSDSGFLSLFGYGQVIRGITFFFLHGSGQSFSPSSAGRLLSIVFLFSTGESIVLSVLLIGSGVLLFEPWASGEDLLPLLKVFGGLVSMLVTEVREEFSFMVLRSKLMHDGGGFSGLEESVDGVKGDINLGRAFSTGSAEFLKWGGKIR